MLLVLKVVVGAPATLDGDSRMPRLLGSLPLLIPDDVSRHLTREGCFSELKLLGFMKSNWWFLGSFHYVTRALIRVQKAF